MTSTNESTAECSAATRKATVLVVDDEHGIREALRMLLKDAYTVLLANSGRAAIQMLGENKDSIDLIFSDIKMPELDGIGFLRQAKAAHPQIEIVMVTAYPSMETALAALRHGAFDYIVKPFDRKEILSAVERGLDRRRSFLANRQILEDLREGMARNYIGTTEALIQTIDAKDSYTRGHSERVAKLVGLLGQMLGLPDSQRNILTLLSRLHDIGKIGVSEPILRKPAPLTPDEWAQMKQHPAIGFHILQPVEFLREELPVVLHHHERFDGRGYPHGLKGKDIPLGARMIAVFDAYDAMISERAYMPRKTPERAVQELRTFAGTQFDPDLVEPAIDAIEEKLGCEGA